MRSEKSFHKFRFWIILEQKVQPLLLLGPNFSNFLLPNFSTPISSAMKVVTGERVNIKILTISNKNVGWGKQLVLENENREKEAEDDTEGQVSDMCHVDLTFKKLISE